jgi:hypothetical protein
MLRRLFAPAFVVLMLAAAAPAKAQDGVVVDPNSPPSKEYALPLEAARNQGSGGGPAAPGGGAPAAAPAFGVGVGSDARAGAASRDGTSLPPGTGSGDDGSSEGGGQSAPASRRLPADERAVADAGGGFGSLLWSIGIASGLVALGVGGAVTVRRSSFGRPAR